MPSQVLILMSVIFPTGFFEMKMKYDESDNALIRASRAVTDKVTDFVGNARPQLMSDVKFSFCRSIDAEL